MKIKLKESANPVGAALPTTMSLRKSEKKAAGHKLYSSMDTMKQQMELMHNVCQRNLNELQINMERYLQDSDRVQNLLNGRSVAMAERESPAGRRGVNNMFALIAFDRYMTQMSTVISMARKFNIHFQLNALNKKVFDTTQMFDAPAIAMHNDQNHEAQTRFLQDFIQWSNNGPAGLDYEKDTTIGSRTLDRTDGFSPERKAIEQATKVNTSAKIKENSAHTVYFKFSNLEAFLSSILPVKDLSHFTEGYTFSATITYVKDYANQVFFVCEMNDYRNLFKVSSSAYTTPIKQSSLFSHSVFGISQEKRDLEGATKCVWRAVKLPPELDESGDSVILIDFGEIIQLTKHCVLYSMCTDLTDHPPMAIKCILKGVSDSDGIVTSDHDKCKGALLSNEFDIAKFRVLKQESRVLHLEMLLEEKPQNSELKITATTNPFLDCLLLEDEAELEENEGALCLPISAVCGHAIRVGPNLNVGAKIGDHLQVTVTHVNSPISFYATIEDKLQEICDAFFWNDDELTPVQKTLLPPKLNDVILAQYSKDKHWYRAQVIEIIAIDEEYKVFYIDFGNTEIVTLDAMASCDRDLLKKPSQAVPFRIAGLRLVNASDLQPNKSWTSSDTCTNINAQNLRKATEYVIVLILNKTINVKLIDRSGSELVVQFLDGACSSISSMLINMGNVAKI